MAIAILLLTFCLILGFVAAAVSRCPLLKTLTLSFDSWADQTRLDAGELS
jgi:hypothetical protein